MSWITKQVFGSQGGVLPEKPFPERLPTRAPWPSHIMAETSTPSPKVLPPLTDLRGKPVPTKEEWQLMEAKREIEYCIIGKKYEWKEYPYDDNTREI